jgi:hypothetical protein
MTYKRFMVFSFPEYYPRGGLGDVRMSYDSLDEALRAINENEIYVSSLGWYIFDRIDGCIVKDNDPD